MSDTVDPKKVAALEKRLAEAGINDSDLVERFVKGSGSGGQKVNKTSNAVFLQHLPSGLEVKVQKSRSREANRFFARRLLLEKFESTVLGKKTKDDKLREKKRKQKNRRRRRSKSTPDSGDGAGDS